MKQTRFLLAALLLMVCGMVCHAQKVVVHKKDGTKVEYKASDVKQVKYKKTSTFKNVATGATLNLKTTTTRPTAGAPASNYAALFNTNDTGAKLRLTANVSYEIWVEGLAGMELSKISADNETYGSNYTYVASEQKYVIYIIQ